MPFANNSSAVDVYGMTAGPVSGWSCGEVRTKKGHAANGSRALHITPRSCPDTLKTALDFEKHVNLIEILQLQPILPVACTELLGL